MKSTFRIIFGLYLISCGWTAERPNFLLIAIDDLNDYVGCLEGHPNASTPNLDRLAKEGVLFTRAYCNSPVCNSSRASIWTGLRPTTTGVTANPSGWFRDRPEFANIATLPQALAASGYATMGFGKLLHLGHGNRSEGEWQRYNSFGYGPIRNPKLNYPEGDRLTDWGIPDGGDKRAPSFDPVIADRTIAVLQDQHDRPFFLGCGFFRPHTPLYAAEKWFKVHPKENVQAPPGYREGDTEDLVYLGKRERREQDIEAPGLFSQDWAEESGKWMDVMQAYLASTSAMDHKLGRVLDALEKSPHRENTYIILFSDHGWHLGEKRHWGKAALWEQTTRVPLIIVGPGIPQGVRYDHPVDLLNIYPTVMDYAGAEPPHKLEGYSLRPVLENPDEEWSHPVLTTFVDHHALRIKGWRYIRYATGEEELYDHDKDPREFDNLAVSRKDDPGIQDTLSLLRTTMDEVFTSFVD